MMADRLHHLMSVLFEPGGGAPTGGADHGEVVEWAEVKLKEIAPRLGIGRTSAIASDTRLTRKVLVLQRVAKCSAEAPRWNLVARAAVFVVNRANGAAARPFSALRSDFLNALTVTSSHSPQRCSHLSASLVTGPDLPILVAT